MDRDTRRRVLVWLAIPSALFVAFKTLSALHVSQVPHRRIAGLYGGQPGATVVLASAFAAFAMALGRIADVRFSGGRFSISIKASPQAVAVAAAVLALAALVFARLYVAEYAWVWEL